jgi:hypothetical protein
MSNSVPPILFSSLTLRKAIVALLATLPAIAAHAQPQQSAQKEAAALFEEGMALMKAPATVAEACGKFLRSTELFPTSGNHLWLGNCLETQKKTASAWRAYREAQRLAGSEGKSDNEKNAAGLTKKLEGSLSRLMVTLQPAAEIPGLAIKVNNEPWPRSSWRAATPADPGKLKVEATAPCKTPWTGEVDLAPNGATQIVELPPLKPGPCAASDPAGTASATTSGSGTTVAPPPPRTTTSPAPPRPDEGDPGATLRTTGYVLGGVGVVGAVLGTYFAIRSNSEFQDAPKSCPASNADCAEPAKQEARTTRAYSIASFITGGAMLAGGIALVLVAPSATTVGSLHVTPRMGAGSAAISLGGTW